MKNGSKWGMGSLQAWLPPCRSCVDQMLKAPPPPRGEWQGWGNCKAAGGVLRLSPWALAHSCASAAHNISKCPVAILPFDFEQERHISWVRTQCGPGHILSTPLGGLGRGGWGGLVQPDRPTQRRQQQPLTQTQARA